MTTPGPTSDNISPLLDDVRAELDRLQHALDQGTLEDTASLSPKMEALMAALTRRPKAEAITHLPDLQSLYGQISTLEDGCRRHADSLKSTLHQLPTLVRAGTAYAKQGATVGKRENPDEQQDKT